MQKGKPKDFLGWFLRGLFGTRVFKIWKVKRLKKQKHV
jgi:hypothetical protein